MKPQASRFLQLLALCILTANVVAQEDLFIRARLSGEQVVPSVATEAGGQVTAILFGNVLTIVGDYHDLSSPIDRLVAGGAHLHRSPEGENGGVELNLNHDFGTEGAFTGIFTLTEEQLQALREGRLYVQIHTESHQAGELRAQLSGNVTLADLAGIWEVYLAQGYLEIGPDGAARWDGSLTGSELNDPIDAGTLRLEGSLLVFPPFDPGGCDTAGRYHVDPVSEGELRVVLHDDACQGRPTYLSGIWKRVSP